METVQNNNVNKIQRISDCLNEINKHDPEYASWVIRQINCMSFKGKYKKGVTNA